MSVYLPPPSTVKDGKASTISDVIIKLVEQKHSLEINNKLLQSSEKYLEGVILSLEQRQIENQNDVSNLQCQLAVALQENALQKAQIQTIAQFERRGSGGDVALNKLNQDLLESANSEIATLRSELDRAVSSLDLHMSKQTKEKFMFSEYKKITKMEHQKLTEQIAQRTILYQALERKRHEEMSENHRSIITDRETIESLATSLKNTEQQLMAATQQNKADSNTIQTLRLELQTLNITTNEQITRLAELQTDNLDLSHKNAEQQRQIEMLRGSSYNDYQDEQIVNLQNRLKQYEFEERNIQQKLKNASEIIANLTKERDSLADNHKLLVTAAQASIQCRQCGYRHEHNSTLTTNINMNTSSHMNGSNHNNNYSGNGQNNNTNVLRSSQDGSALADLNTETGSFRSLRESKQHTPFRAADGKYNENGGNVDGNDDDDEDENNDSISFLGVPSATKTSQQHIQKQQSHEERQQQQHYQHHSEKQRHYNNNSYQQSEQSERDSRISEDNKRHAEQLLQEYQNQIVLLQQQHVDTVNEMQQQVVDLQATLDAKVEELHTLIETFRQLKREHRDLTALHQQCVSKEHLDSAIAVSVRNTEDQLYTQYSNQIIDIQNQLTYYKENEVFCTEQIADLRRQLEQAKHDAQQATIAANTNTNISRASVEVRSGSGLQIQQNTIDGKSEGVVDLRLFEELMAKYTQIKTKCREKVQHYREKAIRQRQNHHEQYENTQRIVDEYCVMIERQVTEMYDKLLARFMQQSQATNVTSASTT